MTPYRVSASCWILGLSSPSPVLHLCSLHSPFPKRLGLTAEGQHVPFLDRWPSGVLLSYGVMHSCMPTSSVQVAWMGRRSWLEVTSSSFPSVVFFSLIDSSAGNACYLHRDGCLVLGLSSKKAKSKGTHGLEHSSGPEHLPSVLEPGFYPQHHRIQTTKFEDAQVSSKAPNLLGSYT